MYVCMRVACHLDVAVASIFSSECEFLILTGPEKHRDPFRGRSVYNTPTDRDEEGKKINIHHLEKNKEMLPTTSNAHNLTAVTKRPAERAPADSYSYTISLNRVPHPRTKLKLYRHVPKCDDIFCVNIEYKRSL